MTESDCKAAVGSFSAENDDGNIAAKTQRGVPEFSSEEALETAIHAAHRRLCDAPTREGKMQHWREMVRLIDLRTPARRRFMDRVRGLA